MYATYTVRRTQVYLDDEQHRLLAARASDEGTTASALIRRAIDRLLRGEADDASDEAFRQALRGLRAGPAADLPDGEEYVESLRSVDAARLRDLDGHAR